MKKILLISLLLAAPLLAQDWELNPDTTFPEEFYIQDTVLIKPTEYPGLSKQIGVFLEKEWGAMIPQVSAKVRPDLQRPYNVLRGDFDGNNKDDWVVVFNSTKNAGYVLFLDGEINLEKNGYGEYIGRVQYYDETFDKYGNLYSYLVQLPADSLNGYKYSFDMLEKGYKLWIETAMPFSHSGFKTRIYNDYSNMYDYAFEYYNKGEMHSIIHDIKTDEE